MVNLPMTEEPLPGCGEDDDLALNAPVIRAAVMIWTLGIFGIAIILARAGKSDLGILVLLGGLIIGIYAFWAPLTELYRSWRRGTDR